MLDLYTFFARLAALFGKTRRDRDLDDEVRFHLDMETEELMRQGMSREDASPAARRNFGGITQVKETYRQRRGLPVVEVVMQDLLYSARMILRRPAFYALVILIFALGIGVNTAVFSVVNGVLLRPLPFPGSNELVRIWFADSRSGQQFLEASYSEAVLLRGRNSVFASIAAFSTAPRTLSDATGEPVHGTVGRLSDNLFTVLGESPSLGRTFLKEEFTAGERVVVLSHRLWQNRYNKNPRVIGELISIDNEPHRIVGVAGIHDYSTGVDLWRPLTRAEQEQDDEELQVIARLRTGVTLDEATAALRPQFSGHRSAWIQSMQAMLVRDVRTPLLLQLAAVGLVLLIACLNIANLLLAHGWRRDKEIAIRTALGAPRSRIVRQLLTEALVLASLGGVLGVVAGAWGLEFIRSISPANIPRLDEAAIDLRVLSAMAVLVAITGIGSALFPAIHIARPASAIRLKSFAHVRRAGSTGMRQGFVVAEIWIASLLLITAVLVVKSVERILTLDRGYEAQRVLTVPISLRGNIEQDIAGFYDRVLENVRTLPGVDRVALAMRSPVDERGLKVAFTQDRKSKALLSIVTADYFPVLKIPLLSGRLFDSTDRRGTRRVAVINDTLAKTAFPGEKAIGRSLHTDVVNEDLLIVGVVGDTTPETNTPQGPAIYVSLYQMGTRDMTLLVRTSSDPGSLVSSIRERIWSVNPAVPLDNIHTLDERLKTASAAPRFNMLLLTLFATFAVALASLGVYGIITDWVGEREHEIGIRRALGAREIDLLWMILRSGLRMTACGLALGILSALWLEQFIRSLLFQVRPRDLATFITVTVVLTAAAVVATLLPALRALRIDPVQSLRSD